MSEQELNLIEFAAGEVTEPRATAPQVMWCKLFYARPQSGLPNDLPQHFRCHSSSPHASGLVDGPEQRTVSDAGGILPLINSRFYPRRDWHRPDMPGLAQQVCDNPVFLAQLNGINAQREQLAARNPHPISIASMA